MSRVRVRDQKLLKKAPRNPDGGWLPPKTKEYAKFWQEMQDEAIRRFGVDEDGDACVIVSMTDNSRQESISYEPIPREIEESPYHPYGRENWNRSTQDPATKKWSKPVHTLEEEETRTRVLRENRIWIRRMIGMNFKLASDRMDRMLHMEEIQQREELEKPERDRLNRIKTLETLKTKWADIYAYYESMGYIVDREANTYTSTAGWRNEEPKPRPIPERPTAFADNMKELARLKKYKPAKELDI